MKSIVETVISAGNFRILINAIQEAGLKDILSFEGPYTIFAPNDDAFSKLPDGLLNKILQDKEKLTEILTYHVMSNKILSKQVSNLKKAKTTNGKEISINTKNGVKINEANLIKADIKCKNGVIHVIDKVLLPDKKNY